MKIILLITLFISLSCGLEEGSYSIICPKNKELITPVYGSTKCCTKCAPGEGMLKLCTDTEDTICSPCISNATFSDHSSAIAKCRDCSKCHEIDQHSEPSEDCSRDKDTQCRCKPNYYRKDKSGKCHKCTSCKSLNQNLLKECNTENGDSACGNQCEVNQFVEEDSRTGENKCRDCRVCTSEEVTLKNCTKTSDTECCWAGDLHCLDRIIQERPRKLISIKENYIIIVCCTILSLIIISTTFYILYKLIRQNPGRILKIAKKTSFKNGKQTMQVDPTFPNYGEIEYNRVDDHYREIKNIKVSDIASENKEAMKEILYQIEDKVKFVAVLKLIDKSSFDDIEGWFNSQENRPYLLIKALRRIDKKSEAKRIMKLLPK